MTTVRFDAEGKTVDLEVTGFDMTDARHGVFGTVTGRRRDVRAFVLTFGDPRVVGWFRVCSDGKELRIDRPVLTEVMYTVTRDDPDSIVTIHNVAFHGSDR